MDLFHKFMNIIVAPIVLIQLILLPPYLFFKFLFTTVRSIFSEDLAGKVILITGASSGIGEHLAYGYARRGARLALVARRRHCLREVAINTELIGCPDTIIIGGDVSKVGNCKHFVDETVNHFGRLDHLVANAGVAPEGMFEDSTDISNFAPAMDINFWGSVYSTYFASPHLKRSKGKIIVIAAPAGYIPTPRLSFYNASKAALISIFETLRIEFGSDIGITIVTPGLILSEMTQGRFLSRARQLEADQEMREIILMPIESAEKCAEAIVNSACRGDKYLTEPSWMEVLFLWKVFCPELIEWFNRLLLITDSEASQMDVVGKKILDLIAKTNEYLTPGIVYFPELKARLVRESFAR